MAKTAAHQVVVTHPDVGYAIVPERAVRHMLPNGWRVVPPEQLVVEEEVERLRDDYLLDEEQGRPVQSDPKPDWVAYAARAGVPDASSRTKSELIELTSPDGDEED